MSNNFLKKNCVIEFNGMVIFAIQCLDYPLPEIKIQNGCHPKMMKNKKEIEKKTFLRV